MLFLGVLAFLGCVAIAAMELLRGSAGGTGRFCDYSSMIDWEKADYAAVRQPTEKELAGLAPLWPTVPPEENAAYYYVWAGVSAGEKPPPGSHSSDRPYAGDAASLRKWIEENRSALELVQKGLERPYCKIPIVIEPVWHRRSRTEFVMTRYPWASEPGCSLASLRSAARLVCDAALVDELDGRYDEAFEWYLRLIRMDCQIRRSGTTFQALVSSALLQMGLTGLNALMANHPLSDEQLRRTISECRSAEVQPGELTAEWRLETVMTSWSLDRQPAGKLWSEIDPPLPEKRIAMKAFPGVCEAIRKTLEMPLDDLVSEQPEAAKAWASIAANAGPLAAWTDHEVRNHRGQLKYVGKDEVFLRATQLRAAIQLYQRAHGKAPEKLDDLCPDFLPAVPMDPFAKAPFRYAIIKSGWKIWSVGADHKDDGGRCPQPSMTWSSRDYVFYSRLETTEQGRAWQSYMIEDDGTFTLIGGPGAFEEKQPSQ